MPACRICCTRAMAGYKLAHERLDAAVVAGAERKQCDLFVASVGNDGIHSIKNLVHGPLSQRTVDHTGVAKATATRASPLDLNRCPVVDRVQVGHDRAGDGWRQRGHDPFAHQRPCLRYSGLDLSHGPVAVIGHLVEARNVHARDRSQAPQQGLPRAPLALGLPHSGSYFQNNILPIAQGESVHEIGQGLRVVDSPPTSDDQGMATITFGSQNRQSGQVEHV